jgi:hypothetical protein
MTRLVRRGLGALGLVTVLGAAAARSATAQSAGAAPAADAPGSAKLVGSWEGPFTTDGPSGTMSVKVTKNGAAWQVAPALTSGEVPPPAAEPSEIKANGNVISWKQVYGEYDVVFKATLSEDGGQLTGTIEASQGGTYVGGGTFTLSRKA